MFCLPSTEICFCIYPCEFDFFKPLIIKFAVAQCSLNVLWCPFRTWRVCACVSVCIDWQTCPGCYFLSHSCFYLITSGLLCWPVLLPQSVNNDLATAAAGGSCCQPFDKHSLRSHITPWPASYQWLPEKYRSHFVHLFISLLFLMPLHLGAVWSAGGLVSEAKHLSSCEDFFQRVVFGAPCVERCTILHCWSLWDVFLSLFSIYFSWVIGNSQRMKNS